MTAASRRMLFWACFTAIAATSAVFAIRGQVIMDWASEFGLTETQKGEILGVVLFFLLVEIWRIFGLPFWLGPALSVLISLGFLAYTRSLGQPVLLLLLVLMIPLATTELGTDSWITSLMEVPMREMAIHAGWVLVYTS